MSSQKFCLKKPFTYLGATSALATAKRLDRAEVRSYRCKVCRAWHLTSEPNFKKKGPRR